MLSSNIIYKKCLNYKEDEKYSKVTLKIQSLQNSKSDCIKVYLNANEY